MNDGMLNEWTNNMFSSLIIQTYFINILGYILHKISFINCQYLILSDNSSLLVLVV